MPPDFFSFPPVLNFDARKASQSVVKQIKSKQNPWESRVKKKKKCVHSSFSPSCSWWGAILAPVTSLSVSLQAASQLPRAPRWLSASIWLSKLMFYISLSPPAFVHCLVHSCEFNQKVSVFLRNVDIGFESSIHSIIHPFIHSSIYLFQLLVGTTFPSDVYCIIFQIPEYSQYTYNCLFTNVVYILKQINKTNARAFCQL